MLETQLLPEQGILVVTPIDKLESADFERLRGLANPYIEEHGGLNGLMIEAQSFPGWEDFAGMLSHFRFIREFESQIKRVALVSDSTVLTILPNIAAHFVAAEVRHFDFQQRERALQWLQDPSTPSTEVP